MVNEEEILESENESIYAYNSDRDIVFIDDVPIEHRGLSGDYFCLGCQKRMQAVLPKTNRQKYFRHHVSKNHKSKCTYSQETHRHFLAKSYLKDLKKIKVPSVIKHSEIDREEAYLIKEAEIIEAFNVVTEKAIYEDADGEIKLVNKNQIDQGKFLYIVPDAILLNTKGIPILLVEFVATHKPDQHKLMKLNRLGINAVQVNVPKSSPDSIKQSLLVSSRTKWLYSNDEQNADFIQLSNDSKRRVYEIDDLQRKLFEEGFRCRKARVGELIRSIEKLLESESYRDTKQHIRSEIQRVTAAKERIKSELGKVREQHIRKGIERHQNRRADVTRSAHELRNRRSELESRYYSKRQRVETEIRDIEGETEAIEESIEQSRNEPSVEQLIEREQEKRRTLESRSKELSGEKERLPNYFERDKEEIRGEIISEEERIEETTQRIRRDIVEQQEKGTSLSRIFKDLTRTEQRSFEETTKRNTQRKNEFRTRRDSIEEIFRRKEVEYQTELSEELRRRREEISNLQTKHTAAYDKGDIGEAIGNEYITNRIPEFEKLARVYSNYLKIHRRFEEKFK